MSPSPEILIECEGVVAGYPGSPILSDINLEVQRGQITVLLGTSGCGKSTLLKTLSGLLPPLSGRVRLFGEDLYARSPTERSELVRRTGMLFQYGALMGSETVFDNIALPLREHTDLPDAVVEEMVHMKLALVGLEGVEERLPGGVSGGQRKRVGLVRATIMDPEILFADEPSAGLDPIASAGLDRLLRRFQKAFRMTMVVGTHELESIRALADHVVMLDAGHVLAQGSIDHLSSSSNERVSDFFGRVAPEYLEEGKRSSVLDAVSAPRRSGR